MSGAPPDLLEALVESAGRAVSVKRADGVYLFVNRRWERDFGLARAAVVGRRDRDLFPKAVADAFRRRDREVVRGKAVIDSEETVDLPGRALDLFTCRFPLRDGRGRVWAVGSCGADVGVSRRAAALLGEAESLAGIGSFEADARTRTARRSPGLYRILGTTPRTMDERPESILRFIHPDDRERFAEVMRDAMRRGKPFSTDYRLRRPDGEERVVHVEGHVSRGADGKPSRVYGWLQDITERRALEAKIVGVADHERRAIGRDLHDDLGQRLTGVALLARALQHRLGARSGEAEALRRVVDEVESTIGRVRELARGLQSVPDSPDGLSRSLRALAAHAQASSRVRCVFRQPGRVAVHDPGVADHLFRIAQEALNNALRHAAPELVEITLKADGRGLELSVADDGGGVKRGARGRSSGLGMSTMRQRAALIHGALSVSARRGGGTIVACRVRA